MRFSLQDVKKQVHRRNGELSVSLSFLRPRELHGEIEQLMAYYEQQNGQPQRLFSPDKARACIGDYRLAHCLIATLGAWYSWQQRAWSEVIQPLGDNMPTLLHEAGITSPIQLRLALFSYVNEQHAGFLDTQTRSLALQTFAQMYQLNVADLEYLLTLDSDEEKLLIRTVPHPPTAQEVATLYNQWAFEAALCSASSVHFVIDCNAFVEARSVAPSPYSAIKQAPTGVGAVIKRLCYLARKLGVYYDLAYESTEAQTSAKGKESAPTGNKLALHLTLYGPQDVTGVPQQYGLRLARLCRLLLGYGHQNARTSSTPTKGTRANISLKAILSAEATIHFLQRSYRFPMDANLLSLFPTVETNSAPERNDNGATSKSELSSVFDSSIEQSFAEAFGKLESSQGVDGWYLEREPEPLLLETGIFIPDFALTRGINGGDREAPTRSHRIYIEILGFWTPAYRERKIQKLQQLKGRNDLVLAIPIEAQLAFAPIAADFPIVWYHEQLSATEILNVLRTRYDDFAERLTLIDVADVQKRVQHEGLVPERTCYKLLHCYRRSELPRAAERIVSESRDIGFTPGIGLYYNVWLEQIRASFVEWIGSVGSLSLREAIHESQERWPQLSACENATIEAMIGLWPEVQVQRTSIFEAMVALANIGARSIVPQEQNRAMDTLATAPKEKHPRERRTTTKKRTASETTQDDLWS